MEENGRLIQFIFRGDEVVAEESGEEIRRYIRSDVLLASDAESARTYYHYASDELGSITHVTEGEEVLNRYEYDAWGNVTESQEKVENRFLFNGQQYDPVSQQYYLRARYYNPVIGRFTQEDTYRGDGLNLYAYCDNNPVYYVDPSGNICEKTANTIMDKVAQGQAGKNEQKKLASYLRNKLNHNEPLNQAEKDIAKKLGVKYEKYSKAYYEGTTTVDGVKRDISRKIYQRNDIDWNRVDPETGLSNKELAQKGSAPYAKDGTKIELHHLLQQEPGTMVEIPASLHDKYYKALHGLVGDGESFRNGPILEKQYNNFRAKYWRWRAKNLH